MSILNRIIRAPPRAPARHRPESGRMLRVFLLGVMLAAAGAPAQDKQQVEAQLRELRAEIETITQQLARQREQRDAELQALARAEQELADIARDLRRSEARLATARERESALQQQAREVEQAIELARDQLGKQLRVAYRAGRQSRLQALLNLQDPTVISRRLALHGYLARARLETISSLERALKELESIQSQQRQLAVELQELLRAQRQAERRQQQSMAKRARALEELNRVIRTRSQQLEAMRRDEAELDQLLQRLGELLADIPPDAEVAPFADLRGHLPRPAEGALRARFATPRDNGAAWRGWLLAVNPGAPVRAVAHGRVAYADWLRGYGMLLIVEHGDGYMTLYGQNQSLLAEVGDWVQAGQIVALAGDTGGRDQAGLYFQIRHDGEPVDPSDWVRQ